MDRNTAAVISEYATEENEFLFLIGKEIKFKNINLSTPAGEISLSKKEVIEIFEKAIREGLIFTDRSKDRICTLISKNAKYIKEIENPNEDMQRAAIKYGPYYIKNIQNPTKQAKKDFLLKYNYSAPYQGYGRQDQEEFKDFTSEEIAEIVKERPESMSGVPTELITGSIVYSFCEGLVRQNLPYLYGAFHNIPDEYKDKLYWQSLCMVHGYNYSGIPKEKREEYISQKLIEYTLKHAENYISTLWMYHYLPEKYKTEELSIRCIMKHFRCISYLPNSLKNDTFYKKLIAQEENTYEDFSWFSDVDVKSISKELFQSIIIKHHITRIPEKTPASYINEDVAIIIAEDANNEIPKAAMTDKFIDAMAEKGFTGRIPADKLTAERAMMLAKSCKYKVLEKIPDKFKTAEFMETVIREHLYCHVSDIKEYLTEKIIEDAIQAGKITRFSEIPTEYRSLRTAELLAEKKVKWLEIPPEYQTERTCRLMLEKYDSKNHEWFYCLKQCKYKPKKAIDIAVKNFKNAIELPELTREQIDESIRRFPLNILHVPEWYLKDEKEEIKPEKANTEGKSQILDYSDYSEFKQLNIFEVLGI